jgi:large subunit ribosomal protein L28
LICALSLGPTTSRLDPAGHPLSLKTTHINTITMFALLRPQCLHAAPAARTFTTSASLAWKSHKNALAELHANVPPYPHGRAYWFKQSDKGLYGGQRIQYGNNVSRKTEIKTRRSWYPNIKRKALFSKALNRRIRVRVSTRVMRTIDKVGGLDEYLLGEKSARIKTLGMEGWRLRCMVMATKTVQNRFNEQRRALGLPEVDYELLASELNQLPDELLDAEMSGEPLEFGVEEDQPEGGAFESVDILGGEATRSSPEDFQQRVDAALQKN